MHLMKDFRVIQDCAFSCDAACGSPEIDVFQIPGGFFQCHGQIGTVKRYLERYKYSRKIFEVYVSLKVGLLQGAVNFSRPIN